MAPKLLAGLIMVAFWKMAIPCTNYSDPACIDSNPLGGDYYLNEWVVKIKGDVNDAKRIASEFDLQYLTPVEKYKDYHKIRYPRIPYRHKLPYDLILQNLRNHNEIELVGQRYVWQPTINDVDNYEDMVGCERPVNVQISHFEAAKVISKRELEGDFRHRDNFRKPEPVDDETLPPLRSVVNLEESYKEKQEEINGIEAENEDDVNEDQQEEIKMPVAVNCAEEPHQPINDEKNQFSVQQQDKEMKILEVIAEKDENLEPLNDDYKNKCLQEKPIKETSVYNQEKTNRSSVVKHQAKISNFLTTTQIKKIHEPFNL